eukprot:SAG11_NODE_35451_length_266_cov_1.191617_1_plen_37_part_01
MVPGGKRQKSNWTILLTDAWLRNRAYESALLKYYLRS